MKIFHIVGAAALLAVALLSGCGGGAMTKSSDSTGPATNYANALAYPDRLAAIPDNSNAMRWIDPNTNFRKYNQVLLERIRVRLDSDSAPVDPNDLKALTDYFHQAIINALTPAYPVVTQPGPGVLRVRATLIDLVGTDTAMSVVVLVTPYATLPDLLSSAADGRPAGSAPYLGKTAIAVEFIDGETNNVVAEYVETRFGRKYVLDTAQGTSAAVTVGAKNYLDAYSTWAYAKQAFDQWATQFRARLDQIHSGA